MECLFNTLGTNVIYCPELKELAFEVGKLGRETVWVVDEHTEKLLDPIPFPNVILKSGEQNKTWDSIEAILSCALNNHLSRSGMFIALGGGVICDLTAFAASIYMRGANVTLVPTTLLCMVDASLGGKTGIDFHNGKNLAGTFFPAKEVIICPKSLKSLPDSQFRSGLAEVLKHSLLSKDERLYNFLKLNKEKIFDKDEKTLKELLVLSLEVKRDYIERDPQEKEGIRQALNLGHTFGHALESLSRMAWLHGNAVAWGTVRALHVGVNEGITPVAFAKKGICLFKMYDYDINYRINRADWIDYRKQLLKDKKRFDGRIKFVLLTGQGKFILTPLDDKKVKEVIINKPLTVQ